MPKCCSCAPDGGGGHVAIAEKHSPRWLHHLRREVELLLNLINHGAPTRVDAYLVERQLEVGDVGLDFLVHQLQWRTEGVAVLLQSSG